MDKVEEGPKETLETVFLYLNPLPLLYYFSLQVSILQLYRSLYFPPIMTSNVKHMKANANQEASI